MTSTGPFAGAIDCDVHPSVPGIQALVPHLDAYWQEMVEVRGIDSLESRSYPPLSPLSARPDWRGANGRAGESVEPFREQLLDRWGERHAILNCLYGVQILHDEAMAAAFTRALNDWITKEWLDAEPRLRASIVLPMQSPELAVDEIERRAGDRRFVQGLVLVMGDMPLGKRLYWPVYRALERHGMPLAVHTGSAYRRAVTAVGWPSTYVEDYVDQAQAFQAQLGSLISHGVFREIPGLKVVLERIRGHLAAGLSLALRQELAGAADGDPLGRPLTRGDRQGPCAADAAAAGCARRPGDHRAGARASGLGRAAALLHRLPALAVRRRRGAAGLAFRGSEA